MEVPARRLYLRDVENITRGRIVKQLKERIDISVLVLYTLYLLSTNFNPEVRYSPAVGIFTAFLLLMCKFITFM
jgi:hypothetical protein